VKAPAKSGIRLHFAYLLRCADGSLYAGSTRDLAAREARHNEGRGGRYTAGRRPVRIVHAEGYLTQREAMGRERELKRLTKAAKERLCRPS
jgi:putative endonuclease